MSTTEKQPETFVERQQQNQLLSVMPDGKLDIVSMGRVLAQSGYFKDIKSLSQGIVKIMLGAELGLGPLMSIMKLYIVKENPVISANLMASRIRQSGNYDYEIVALDDKRSEIRFSRKKDGAWKVLVPNITFTLEDAKRAHLGGSNGGGFNADSNWAKWPRNMLFARAMSDGYRFHCPDVFSMAVYTPADFDVKMDAAGEIIRDITPEKSDENLDTDKGKSAIERIVEQNKKPNSGMRTDGQSPSEQSTATMAPASGASVAPGIKESAATNAQGTSSTAKAKSTTEDPRIGSEHRAQAGANGEGKAPAQAAEHLCPECGYVMIQLSDDVASKDHPGSTIAVPNGKYICHYCTDTAPKKKQQAADDPEAGLTEAQFDELQSLLLDHSIETKLWLAFVKGPMKTKMVAQLKQKDFCRAKAWIEHGGAE